MQGGKVLFSKYGLEDQNHVAFNSLCRDIESASHNCKYTFKVCK